MNRTTIEHVVCYLFHDLSPPFVVLDQNHCSNVEIENGLFVPNFNENKLTILRNYSTTPLRPDLLIITIQF